MFQCVWCKKDSNVWEWSKQQEPLCSECSSKYHFGVSQKMITGSVSDLSKEQRREVSERMHSFERFWGALRSVERETLIKRSKTISHITGWILFAVLILTMAIFSDWFVIHKFSSLFAIVVYICLAYLLHRRIVWYIKYWQLKRKVKESGYGGI